MFPGAAIAVATGSDLVVETAINLWECQRE